MYSYYKCSPTVTKLGAVAKAQGLQGFACIIPTESWGGVPKPYNHGGLGPSDHTHSFHVS